MSLTPFYSLLFKLILYRFNVTANNLTNQFFKNISSYLKYFRILEIFIAIHIQEDNFYFLVIILNQINEIEARCMPVIPA